MAQGLPLGAQFFELTKFGGLNTQGTRSSIGDEEFSWLENLIPIGPGNLRSVYGPAVPVFQTCGPVIQINVFTETQGASWTNSIITKFSAIWPSQQDAITYFASGGNLAIALAQPGGTALDVEWNQMYANMGQLFLTADATSINGSGTGGTVNTTTGFNELGALQTLYTGTGTFPFDVNTYTIAAVQVTNGVQFTLTFTDIGSGQYAYQNVVEAGLTLSVNVGFNTCNAVAPLFVLDEAFQPFVPLPPLPRAAFFDNVTIESTVNLNATAIFSVWVRAYTGLDLSTSTFLHSSDGTGLLRINLQQINGASAVSFFIFADLTQTEYFVQTDFDTNTLDDTTWHHLILTWSIPPIVSSGSLPVVQIYVDGVNRVVSTSFSGPAYNFAPVAGGQTNFFHPAAFVPVPIALVAELYFAAGQYLDLSNPSNIAKFYNAGFATELGPNGALPTGLPPSVYCSGPGLLTDFGYLTAQPPVFGTNRGTGGPLTSWVYAGDWIVEVGFAPNGFAIFIRNVITGQGSITVNFALPTTAGIQPPPDDPFP